ncbi:hypothetical protein I203_101634 [Kwoniella mangroviensis CBS 8507]|uniref:uncharacterized protein n=1 Tax=Kwoniella mangroviensis CBS 8507 TaxID=1296122 RepID=UPI0030685885
MPELFEWPCDSSRCQSKFCAQTAICDLCYQALCPEHDVAPAHACRTPRTTEQRWNAQDNAQRRYVSRRNHRADYAIHLTKYVPCSSVGYCRMLQHTRRI